MSNDHIKYLETRVNRHVRAKSDALYVIANIIQPRYRALCAGPLFAMMRQKAGYGCAARPRADHDDII